MSKRQKALNEVVKIVEDSEIMELIRQRVPFATIMNTLGVSAQRIKTVQKVYKREALQSIRENALILVSQDVDKLGELIELHHGIAMGGSLDHTAEVRRLIVARERIVVEMYHLIAQDDDSLPAEGAAHAAELPPEIHSMLVDARDSSVLENPEELEKASRMASFHIPKAPKVRNFEDDNDDDLP